MDEAEIKSMVTHKSSNLNRAAYRTKFRQKLADHICIIQTFDAKGELLTKSKGTKLGISIEPAEVRLIPSANDPYIWRILPEKQHLFKKHLSKHSIGKDGELYREVGMIFEAILATDARNALERKSLEETQKQENVYPSILRL
jgi:hypothetical protein